MCFGLQERLQGLCEHWSSVTQRRNVKPSDQALMVVQIPKRMYASGELDLHMKVRGFKRMTLQRCEREIVTCPDRKQLLSLIACAPNGPHQIRAERLKMRLHADAGTALSPQ